VLTHGVFMQTKADEKNRFDAQRPAITMQAEMAGLRDQTPLRS